MKYKFSDKEIDGILNNLVILVDTREQTNDHILEWLKAKKKNYKVVKLDYGDYGCYLPAGSFKGQLRDIYFTDDIVIERKFCIDELAMNLRTKKENINEMNKEVIDLLGEKYLEKVLKSDYSRLKQELTALNKYGVNFFIFLEDPNFDYNIRNQNYRANYKNETLYKRLKALEREFKTMIRPISKKDIASEIYNTLRYGIRDIFKNRGYFEEGDEFDQESKGI